MEFKNPEFLWLLILVPLVMLWHLWRWRHSRARLLFPGAQRLAQLAPNRVAMLAWVLPLLRWGTLTLLILALARPQTSEQNIRTRSEKGVDIVMAIDISTSMLSRDFEPNRLEATKNVVRKFIRERLSDRVGLVLYAGEAFTKIPLSADQEMLTRAVEEITNGLVEDGTAIGMGLATAVNRLRKSEAKSKVVILLSDGENNAGNIDPRAAAELAREFGIKVYTVGVGSDGMAPTPYAYDYNGKLLYRTMQVRIDEDLLREIARLTGGQYYRAQDATKLESIYREIDQMEKTEITRIKYATYSEKFTLFAIPALLLFALEILLRYTYLKSMY